MAIKCAKEVYELVLWVVFIPKWCNKVGQKFSIYTSCCGGAEHFAFIGTMDGALERFFLRGVYLKSVIGKYWIGRVMLCKEKWDIHRFVLVIALAVL